MKFRADGFDVWVFRRTPRGPEYLLLRTSREKAERWFGGGEFWQIPSDFTGDLGVVQAVTGELGRLGLQPLSVWAAEHAYTIYNRRYEDIVHLAVFAAEVEDADAVRLGPEHAEHAWVAADEAQQRVTFRGLREGLLWVRHYITEAALPPPALRLA
jgi:hypothetical protein